MRRNRDQPCLAVVLVALLLVRPTLGGPPIASAPAGGASVVVVDPLAAWAAVAQLQRTRVVEQLITLGRSAEQANSLVAHLTADDLAVLNANPRMMQMAGTTNARQLTLLWGVLIVAGIIALAAATDGFVSFG